MLHWIRFGDLLASDEDGWASIADHTFLDAHVLPCPAMQRLHRCRFLDIASPGRCGAGVRLGAPRTLPRGLHGIRMPVSRHRIAVDSHRIEVQVSADSNRSHRTCQAS